MFPPAAPAATRSGGAPLVADDQPVLHRHGARARWAIAGSWVITSRVVAASQSSSKTCRMSRPEVESRLPVGSSAEQQVGLAGERAGDRDALHLAARQLGRLVAHPVGEADIASIRSVRSRRCRVAIPANSSGSSTFS